MNFDVTYTLLLFKENDFLTIVGAHSSRWTSLSIGETEVEDFTAAGLTAFHNLNHLTYCRDFEADGLDGWNMPMLSRLDGYRCTAPPDRMLAQLTYVELKISNEHLDIPSMARAFYCARSLLNLTLRLEDWEAAPVSSLLDAAEIPAPQSFKIQSLKITVRANNSKSTVYNITRQLHGDLSYLLPLAVDISLDRCPFEILYGEAGELFPDGTSIKFHIACSCDIIDILARLLQRCDFARSLQLEAPRAVIYASSWTYYSWTRFSSIHHLCFRNCDKLTEYGAKSMANKLLSLGANVDLQLLEFTHCKRVSEEHLLNLHDNFGDKLKWTL